MYSRVTLSHTHTHLTLMYSRVTLEYIRVMRVCVRVRCVCVCRGELLCSRSIPESTCLEYIRLRYVCVCRGEWLGIGWRRPIGCLKLQVIFRKRATNYRALFWKMTYGDKASYGSSPPCIRCIRELTCLECIRVRDVCVCVCVCVYVRVRVLLCACQTKNEGHAHPHPRRGGGSRHKQKHTTEIVALFRNLVILLQNSVALLRKLVVLFPTQERWVTSGAHAHNICSAGIRGSFAEF